MRIPAKGRFALLLAALAAAGCDSPTITASGATGRVTAAIPRLGIASMAGNQTNAVALGALEPSSIHALVTLPSSGATLLDKIYSAGGPSFTPDTDPGSAVAGTAVIEFPVPAGAERETFSFTIGVRNSDGTVLYTMGPTPFTLGADGRSASVEGTATYVGPGSSVTSVQLQPRAITLTVGQTQPVTCVGNPGAVVVFPFVLSTANASVASVDDASVVHGVSRGTTQLTCTAAFGTHPSDAITVVVVPPVAKVIVMPNPGTVGVGSTLQMSASTLDAANNTLTGRAVSWATSNAAVATVGPTTGVVTGVAAGSVTITATSEGITGTAAVNVLSTGSIGGAVQDAGNGLPLSGVLVEVRAGSATTGPTVASSTTNATGTFSFPNLAPSPYTLLASKTGYTSLNVSTTVAIGQTASVTVALPPVCPGICIVLTWGAVPDDLDSHLYLPDGTHVWWDALGSCTSYPFACLVHDEVVPFSSEFTNITQMQAQGTYAFDVFDYSDGINQIPSTNLSNSNARVDVFVGGVLRQTFRVPGPGQYGWLWKVFTLSGSISAPTITPVNQLTQEAYPAIRAPGAQATVLPFTTVKKAP